MPCFHCGSLKYKQCYYQDHIGTTKSEKPIIITAIIALQINLRNSILINKTKIIKNDDNN